ncbi:MAG: response regulator [Lysobacter sp.]|nr:response regulator [Lysobacter sp.]
MTALHEAIEYSALGWVKPELDETLRLVRVEVEGFADDPTDTSRMRVCTELLHQVQGTLRMVELYAPAMVAEEMERLSVALQNGEGVAGHALDRDVACSALMRGVVLLPDYLERLQSGHKEISIVLLPMLNELRAARGDAGLSESVLFVPDLDRALPPSLPRAAPQSAAARANEVAPHLARLRDALRAWPEQGTPGDTEGLHFAAEALLARTADESQRRMLWVASMVAGALRDGAMTSSAGLRQAFASVDRETRGAFNQSGFDAPRPDAALEPTRQLLYHVAHSESVHPALMKLREVFDLDALRPTESELDHARGSVAGRNRSLLDTVAAAVKEDLLRVKDALDLYLRTSQNDPAALQPQAEALQRVSDTLGMLGLGLARTLVQQQRDAMQEIVDSKRKADETALLDIAGALLYVDASLDDQVARLASGDGADTEEDLAGAEARKVLDVLVREAITNFASARQAFDAFVETSWNHAELAPVPKLLRDVSGALNILELPQPAQYLDGVRMYTEVELLDRHRIPNGRQLDTFADALASLEYYLEALRDRRATRDDILDITRNSLETLGYWPLPAERAVAPVVEAPAFAPRVAEAAPGIPVSMPEPVESSIAETTHAEQFSVAPPAEERFVEELLVEARLVEEPLVQEQPAQQEPVHEEQVHEEQVQAALVPELPAHELPVREQFVEEALVDGPAVEEPAVEELAVEEPEAVAAEPPAAPFVPLFLPPRETAPAPARDETPPAPAAVPVQVSTGFDTTSDDIDDEIREIFLEEFEEEIANLGQLLPAWKADPGNIERLQPVRRVFHTLKGSGRLVGAKTLGEFSWKIENMLNRVRDGHRPATSPVIAIVEQAYVALPQLHAALRGDGAVTTDLRAIEAFADRIAGGEEVMPMAAAAKAVEAAPVVAFEAVVADFTAGALIESEDEGIPVSVDAVLFEILQAEVGGHLNTIDGWLARAHGTQAVADEPLVRAIHTMNGAFAMTEVPSITDALTPAEGYVRRLLASAGAADAEGVAAIAELTHRVRDTIAALSTAGGRVPHCDALAARFVELRDRLPESRPVSAVDEPLEYKHDETHASRDIELTDLDLSAYGNFDVAPPAPPVVETVGADPQLEVMPLDSDIEDELARLLGQSVVAPAATLTPTEADAGVATDPEDAKRLLALMESYEAERLEAERLEAERLEAERLEAEHLEAERLEVERLEAERLEAERLEVERLEAERLEAERLEAERLEVERLEAERLEAERLEAERLEAERLEAERLEAERLEVERLEAERLEAERLEAERLEAERLEAERLEAERAEIERLEAERLEAALRGQGAQDFDTQEEERLEAESREAELLEAERLLAEGGEPEPGEHIELPAFADFGEIPQPIPLVDAIAPDPVAANTAPTVLTGASVIDPDIGLDMSDLDSDLVDIFVEEGHDLLDHSDQMLVRLRERPDEREAIIGLQRDLHTLKGGARMAGIMAIGELGHAMESLLEAAAEHRLQLEKQDIPLLERGFDRLHTMVTRVGDRRAVAMPDILITAFDARAIGIPVELPAEAPLDARGDVEAVHVEEAFLDAVSEDASTAGTHASGSPDAEAISVEEISLGDYAFEDFTFDAPAREVPADDVALVEDSIDTTVVEVAVVDTTALEAGELAEPTLVEQTFIEDANVDDAIVSLVASPEVAEHAAADEAVADAANEAVVDAALPSAQSYAALPALKPLSVPMEFGVSADDDVGLRGSQEQVRVRAELLDRLVNYAGEVAIYRSRLEQQLGAFRGATAEMEQTNTRLRDQLRRLDIETEAQIIARYQREGETRDATFDPLELDRFSNLQQLSRALAETAADLGSLHNTLDDLTQGYETLLLQQSRVSSELQEGLMRTRMVPFDTVVPRLRRVLRQAATDTGKQVQLKLDGAQGELDRNVLERMTAPLEHMLRNAMAHGLEKPAKRKQAGKPEEGTVTIAVRKEGSEVVLQISDDGAGLDRKAIRERGETRGLVRKGVALSNAQLDALILEPGFSTAEEVSRLAGRGVGMDVVASEVRQLGGTLDIQSERSVGTVFTLRLPQTLAVTQAAFVRIGETTFAVPIASVRGVGRIRREELTKGDLTSYRYGNEEYVLHDLGKLLGHAPAKAEGQLQMPLLLTRSGDLHIAVTVDQIIGNREIVVKPIGPQVASIPGIFGATIMGDGSVMVILDIAPLVRRQAALLPEVEEEAQLPAAEQRAVPLVMVVDDSITMRKVSSRVLERNNFEVVTAKDGIDALERMVDRVPDLMLLDIEMPRMDGYELATAMKADPRLANVPIIMITSRTGDKHRQRAMDIGVNRYLGKPYQENELMRNVFSLLEAVRSDA